jgi:hypothetical protein
MWAAWALVGCSSEVDGDPLPGVGGTSSSAGGNPSGAPSSGGTSNAGAGSPAGGSNQAGGSSAGGASNTGGGGTPGGAGSQAGAPPGGSGGTSGAPTGDCSSAPADECPFPAGVVIGCKRRFALGINYAWRDFGSDFGGLAAWGKQGVARAPDDYRADLTAMKAAGASVIRWWVFPDFRGDGVQFDGSDDPTGLSANAALDMTKALELAETVGVYLVPTIFSFDGFRPKHTTENVTIRSLAPLVTAPARRAKVIANVVTPLAKAAAASPHRARLLGWDLMNEPEWAISPSGQNSQDFTPNEELTAISLADMKAFLGEIAAAVKVETPSAFTSVGWAAAKWAWAFNDLALDVNQPHIYGWVNEYWPYTKKPAELGYPATRPTIMGEFFLQSMPFSDRNANDTFAAIMESWWSNGYAGAWPWQHFDGAANLPLIKTFADAKGCQVRP